MKRSGPLRRNKPLSPISKKTRSLIPTRKAVREIVLNRDDNRCQAQIYACTYHATDVHEIVSRGRGGSPYDPDNCLSLCRSCHRYITENPEWATAHGFLLPAWAGVAEYRAAERARHEFTIGGLPEYDDDPEETT